MKRLWFSLAAGLLLAAATWHARGDRAGRPTDSPVASTGNSASRTAPPRRGVATPRVADVAQLDDADAIADLTAAQIDDALAEAVGDAQSYWELSPDARAEYDRREAQRLARLGVDDVTRRLAPHHEVMTLDGEAVTP